MSKLDRFYDREDAVSPVIATILMVAITVVLAGTLYVWATNYNVLKIAGGMGGVLFSN